MEVHENEEKVRTNHLLSGGEIHVSDPSSHSKRSNQVSLKTC